jgi:hypothetical protein
MIPMSDLEPLDAVCLAPGVAVERMGEELLALVGHQVVRVSGPAAAVLAAVWGEREVSSGVDPRSGPAVDASEVPRAVDVLVDLGVLERSVPSVETGTPEGTGGAVPLSVSRRRALGVAATAAALGVTVLVLPQAAAASSGDVAFVSGDSGTTVAGPTAVSFSDVGEEEFTVTWTSGVPT